MDVAAEERWFDWALLGRSKASLDDVFLFVGPETAYDASFEVLGTEDVEAAELCVLWEVDVTLLSFEPALSEEKDDIRDRGCGGSGITGTLSADGAGLESAAELTLLPEPLRVGEERRPRPNMLLRAISGVFLWNASIEAGAELGSL